MRSRRSRTASYLHLPPDDERLQRRAPDEEEGAHAEAPAVHLVRAHRARRLLLAIVRLLRLVAQQALRPQSARHRSDERVLRRRRPGGRPR